MKNAAKSTPGSLIVWLLLCLSTPGPAFGEESTELKRFEFDGVAMAAPVKLILYTSREDSAEAASKQVFDRLEALNAIMSDYDPDSELSRLCQQAGSGCAVPVSTELWSVLTEAQRFAELTDGAFDVTVGPVVRLWRRARRQRELPDPERLQQALQKVGYRKLQLLPDRQAVVLRAEGMQLDLGGIAKGYAGDQALAVLKAMGISRALVDIGGDICLGDPPPQSPGWRVAIEPLRPEDPPPQILILSRCAIATSGDTQRFVIIDGKRYSHIIDPRTGRAMTGNMSVTIVAPDGLTADALASAVRVLGPDKGLSLVDKLPRVAGCVVFLSDESDPTESPTIRYSARWSLLPRFELPAGADN